MDHSKPDTGACSRGRARPITASRGDKIELVMPPTCLSSSPSTTDSVMGPIGLPPTPPTLLGVPEQDPSPSSCVGDTSFAEEPLWGSVDPVTKKIWIRPLGRTEFYPYKEPNKYLNNMIFRNYTHTWGFWKDVPPNQKDAWRDSFLNNFRWLPEHRADLIAAFKFKVGKGYANKIHNLRYDKGDNSWCHSEAKRIMLENWAVDEGFQARSARNKQNRAHMEEGTYAGGCISISEHKRRIQASGEVPPDQVEFATFQRTHTQESKAGTRRWLNNTSRQIAEGFQKLQEETQTQVTDDGTASSQVDSNELFIKATEPFNKKGRIFGLGASASIMKSTKRPSRQLPSVSEDELARMREVTAKLEAKLQQQKEQREKNGSRIAAAKG
ncbi:uncharacterized protein LOC133293479 [Gastrolobium bilobum]|uniref:uncharacterized protein LOC133293479 n=1 Tax=Gastrolobium bilobum TaxID=150636 RepID=UPI002AAF574B|nr:uncharacterized protein LOC133293479 [Gastrolobium bilobum]